MLECQQRLLRTIIHLEPRQVAYQFIRRLVPKARVSVPTGFTPRTGLHLEPPLPRFCGGELWALTFLNIRKEFDPVRFDWASQEQGKLWRYNLHYFDYLQEPKRSNGPELIESWLLVNPLGTPDAWEPYPVSLRMVNWIKFFLSPAAHGKVEERWLQSLYQQALWLEKNIEYHLLANHYFKNGKALIFAGLFFCGSNADRWLKKGLNIVEQELNEQILPDGGHFERSPMYHAMILEDCLDLFNIMGGQKIAEVQALQQRIREKAEGMLGFLAGMTHPDGEIALFNDAALGIEAKLEWLAAYFERLTRKKAPSFAGDYGSFAATGYYVMAPQAGDRLIVDCGPVGPDYQPGHAHCDTLSFELSLKGRRVIVDSGCCQYVDGEIRRYNRGNAGHNTVTIDGENQSEVWGAHRCARRARPLYGRLDKMHDGTLVFKGAHNGYQRLKGKPVHHRTITWSGHTCLIEDRIEGRGRHDIESRLHIHPTLVVEGADGCVMIRDGADHLATISVQGGSSIATSDGWYCPEFGLQQPCVVLVSRFNKVSLPFSTGWVIYTSN